MSPQRTTTTTKGAPDNDEDLSLVRHVGPGTVKRLTDAGVTTLTAIARSTPQQLAQASGYSAAKIEKENWIGQARRLIGDRQPAARTSSEPGTALVVAPKADPSHRVATFRLELTIQPDGTVHHSDVTYLQDETKREHWSSWDEARLVGFVREVAGLEATPAHAAHVPSDGSTEAQVANEVPLEARDVRTVKPETFTLELQGEQAANSVRALAQDGEAEVVVGLPLRGLVSRPTRPVRHRVEVVAVEVGGGERHVVATSAATDQYASGELTLRVPASMPPAGLYRLRAELLVAPTETKSKASAAVLRSGPLLVR